MTLLERMAEAQTVAERAGHVLSHWTTDLDDTRGQVHCVRCGHAVCVSTIGRNVGPLLSSPCLVEASNIRRTA